MTTLTVTNASEGTTLATGGTLKAIRWILPPFQNQYRSVLRLVDDGVTPEKTLWHQDVGADPTIAPKFSDRNAATNWTDINHTSQWGLLNNGNATFAQLTVKSCPAGSKFEIDCV
jgi:hypothetical protein